MATNCDVCGNRTNEVKSGGGTEPKGIHIEVDVNGKEDFSRDVLKVKFQNQKKSKSKNKTIFYSYSHTLVL